MDHSDQAQRLLTSAARARFIREVRGFTLAEVLITVVIVGLLTVVVAPMVLSRLTDARADAIITEMRSLQDALQLFNRDVGRYPRRLDYLNVLPTPATNVFDACGTVISATNQAKFRGPYINREIVMLNPGGGITKYVLATGDSVESLLTRTTITNPVTGGTQQVLQILVYGPPQSLTQQIDSLVDGTLDKDNGIIQYAAPLPNSNTIKWSIPITNGAC